MTAQTDALVRDLQADPAAASALRQVILGEDFVTASHVDARFDRVGLALDRLTEAQTRTEAKVGQLAEAQNRTEAKVGQLAEAQSRTEAKVGQLAEGQSLLSEAQGRTEAKFAQLMQTQAQTSADVQALVAVVSKHDDRLGTMDGRMFELDAERKGPALFSSIARRLRVIEAGRLAVLLDDAVTAGRIDAEEFAEAILADVVLRGRRSDQPVHLVVEASVTLNHDDIDRARRRADLMGRATDGNAIAVGYGTRAHPAVLRAASSGGVWMVVGGHMIAPDPA